MRDERGVRVHRCACDRGSPRALRSPRTTRTSRPGTRAMRVLIMAAAMAVAMMQTAAVVVVVAAIQKKTRERSVQRLIRRPVWSE